MRLTILETKTSKDKRPVSKWASGEFDFYTLDVTWEMLRFHLRNSFILNYPLKTNKIRAVRSTNALGDYFADFTDFVILDFDHIFTRALRDQIVQALGMFKGFCVPSRSYNGMTCFNFRAAIEVEKFKHQDVKSCVKFINAYLERNGVDAEADFSATNNVQVTAPNLNSDLWIEELKGKSLKVKDLEAYHSTPCIHQYTSELQQVVFELFHELGFYEQNSSGSSDKVYFMQESTQKQGYIWYANSPLKLWHFNSARNVDVSVEFNRRYKLSDFTKKVKLSEIIKHTNPKSLIVNEHHFDMQSLNKSGFKYQIEEWRDKGGVFCLKSAMGTGKTNIIKNVLEMFQNVLIVTPRVSLASQLAANLGVSLYTDDIKAKHLVCQFDSLRKLDVQKFQCVIFDEFMTLESHSINNCSQQYTVNNMAKMQSLLGNPSVNVMLVDAMLEKNVLDHFRERVVYWCVNDYRDRTPIFQHKNLKSFAWELSQTTSRRITVSCVSKAKMPGLENFLRSAGHNPASLSSDNSTLEREEILEKFKTGEVTALIYSPCISVGISIETHVDRHFHFDPGRVISPIQSIQMMKRARGPKQIDYFVGKSRSNENLSLEEIQNKLIQTSSPTAFCTFNKFGDAILSPAGKLYSHFMLHDKIWKLDYLESFNLLIQNNFLNVVLDHVSRGSQGTKNVKLHSCKVKETKWSTSEKEKLISLIGGYYPAVEDLLDPKEVETFSRFLDLRRSAENNTWKRMKLAAAAVRGDFIFSKKLQRFEEIQNSLDPKGYIKKKVASSLPSDWLKDFGLEKVTTITGSKFVLNTKFLQLEDIMKDEDLKNQRFGYIPLSILENLETKAQDVTK